MIKRWWAMNKTWILIKHEFIQAIKKPGFIITTLMIPVLSLLSLGINVVIGRVSDPSEKEAVIIGYVDETGIISGSIDEGLISLIPYQSLSSVQKDFVEGEITEYIIIPEDFLTTGTVNRFTQKKELFPPLATNQSIKNFLTLSLIKDKVPPEMIKSILSPLDLEVIRLDEFGEISNDQGSVGNILVPAVYAFLLTMTFQYGTSALISGLGEEKESRLIEVLYSSVSTRQLMVGKILALGASGLLQVVFWLSSAPLLINLSSASVGGFFQEIEISTIFIILGVVYYILGYLQFATMSVTLGSISSNTSEAHNLSMIYTLICYVPIWTVSAFMNFPDSPIWVVLTIFPITAPIQTLIRVGVSDVPGWQIAASLGVLTLSVITGIYLAEKVFRTFMLMYGKRLRFKEIVQGLRNA